MYKINVIYCDIFHKNKFMILIVILYWFNSATSNKFTANNLIVSQSYGQKEFRLMCKI